MRVSKPLQAASVEFQALRVGLAMAEEAGSKRVDIE